MNKKLLSTILKGLAVAMGIAVIVLNILGQLETKNGLTLLGVGLAALAIAAFQKTELLE